MLWLYILLGILGGLLLIFFIILAFLHHGTFYSPLKGQNDNFLLTQSTKDLGIDKLVFGLINSLLEVPYEDAYIKSFDKLKLHARVYENKESNKLVIMFHGYRGTAVRDFSGGAKLMIDQGYNVILVDQRAHGESEGHNITFGNREKKDVLSWIEYGQNRFGKDKELILVGISMGAATLLFASKYIQTPAKLICDCPYTTEKEIIKVSIKKMKLPQTIFYPIVNLSSILFSHASLNKDDAHKNVKECHHKILIIHGDKDTIVPYQYSYNLYLENKDKIQYELFPNTEHGVSFVTDTERYKKIVIDFINQ